MNTYKIIKPLVLFLSFVTLSSCNTTKKEVTETKLPVFNYTSKTPENGKLLGVVELGAHGFNSFIINVDKDLNWELKDKEFGISLIVEGMTNAQLINQKLREYIEKIQAFGLTKEDIHFVVSSGAAKEEITAVISKELENIGYKVNNVTPAEEGEYALKAVLPEAFFKDSFLVDIGSGNTKISYFEDNNSVTIETHGAKYYQKGMEDTDVYNDVKNKAAKVPLEKRKKCFILGGVPTELAIHTRKKEELYTVLNPNTSFYNEFANKKGKKTRSGLNIFKAIQEETNVQEIIYFINGNFTIGFLLDKIKKQGY